MRLQPSLWALLSASTTLAVCQADSAQVDSSSADSTTADSTSVDSADYYRPPQDFNSKCAAIASKLAVDKGTVHFSRFVSAGTNLSLPDNDPSCTTPFVVVPADICRIALSVKTSSSSGFNMEAWLPSNWTGRFLSTGNGGLAGCIQYRDLAYASSLGFSTVGTNNGHNGTSGLPFYNNPGVVEDFAYRALHTGVVVGKQISKGFYSKPHTKSYYLGCSTGGRQGFKSAQDFPDDFDGIVAGAPAFAFNNLTSWSGHFYLLTGPPGSPTYLPPPLWVQVHIDVLKQCDALDGYVDGIIEYPLQCNYNPSGLICPSGSNSTNCLTPTQAETVKAVFKPLLNAKGDLVYPRLQPGAEVVAAFVLFNGAPFPYTTDWFRYAIYNDPNWDPTKLNTTDYDNAARINPFNIQTWKGDLSAVKKRGSKILHWHGGADFIISSDNSPRYYNHVSSTMGLSPTQLDSFYRYFTVSGTGHCGGGDGAHAIGQSIAEVNSYDPSENILMAMVNWVEKGKAPETIIGTKWVNDTQSLGVDFQRAHCKFPKRNKYKGTGNPKVVSSWQCVDP